MIRVQRASTGFYSERDLARLYPVLGPGWKCLAAFEEIDAAMGVLRLRSAGRLTALRTTALDKASSKRSTIGYESSAISHHEERNGCDSSRTSHQPRAISQTHHLPATAHFQ